MIAMALVLEPALLIADEPTTALDVTTQAQILQLIQDLQREHGTGVLFITHDFGVVAEIADRVAVMQPGRLVEVGRRPSRCCARPQHAYTRMLIGAVPSLAPQARASARRGAESCCARAALDQDLPRGGWFAPRPRGAGGRPDVDLEVRRGETLGIVGESGSGKSTVARCIARLIDPTAGEIWLDGDDDRAHARGAPAAPAPPARADRVPGPLPLAQPAPHGRRRRSSRGR